LFGDEVSQLSGEAARLPGAFAPIGRIVDRWLLHSKLNCRACPRFHGNEATLACPSVLMQANLVCDPEHKTMISAHERAGPQMTAVDVRGAR
jgi:hypothetical protein